MDGTCEMLFIIWLWFGLRTALASTGVDEPPLETAPHCFKRIASGERLVGYDVTRIIDRGSAGECEEECNVYRCTFFSFGYGPLATNATNGNGTCELTTDREISRRQDPNFDLYERTTECAEGKPTGYEKACYRRIITGKRLHERFIRHSLPCNSLQACQHQCSIEKHFTCEGFNIRLDPAGVGRGICELSSIDVAHLDHSRDFVFDPEFAYYERDRNNGLPNCGPLPNVPNLIPPPHDPEENTIGHQPAGGPYYGGDSYGPWSSGHGTVEHGPWGSHGYGSGFYEPSNPSRGPPPSFNPDTPRYAPDHGYGYGHGYNYGYGHDYGYGYGYGYGYDNSKTFHGAPRPPTPPAPSYLPAPTFPQAPYPPQRPFIPFNPPRDPSPPFPHTIRPRPYGYGRPTSPWHPPSHPPHSNPQGGRPSWSHTSHYPSGDRRHGKPNRVPTYIIIDADASHAYGEPSPKYPSYRPSPARFPLGPPAPRSPPPPPPPRRPPPPPPSPPDTSFGISSNAIAREVCFRRQHSGYKLNQNTIRGMYDTPTVLDCEAMCTNSPFKCTGYSYRYASGGSGPNCLLTDHSAPLNPQTHLLPDRSCDVYFRMTTCMEFDRTADTECFLKVASNRKLDSGRLVKAVSVSGMSDCELACLSAPFFTCRSFSFRHGPPVIGEPLENCFLSDWPMSALTHLDLIPAPNHEVYERGSFGHGCELDSSSPHIGPKPPFTPYPNIPQITFGKEPWSLEETWRHFTVSGWPCRSGTECSLNPVGGFWACEVEGGDHAQWDYCCRPKHSCGFSRGFHYPWCYVGEGGPEQWRPCSEFYYPEFGNRYQYEPVHPVDSHGPPTDTRPWNFGPEEFGPPTSWPISYIYAEPPPNETYVWDSEDFHFYPHSVENPPQSHHDDSPRIRFKPCSQRHPYPRAIVQKLDLKHAPKAPNPEEQSLKDDHPTTPKPTPTSPLHSTLDTREKKNSRPLTPSPTTPTPTPAPTSTHHPPNPTTPAPDKTKQLIQTVEKLIMDTTAVPPPPDKNETLTRLETNHPPFFSLTLLEQPYVWE